MQLRLLVLMLCLLSVAATAAVPWESVDVDEAVRRAENDDKRVLVYFGATWCGACRKLESEVFDAPDGERLADDFVPLQFDADSDAARPVRERYNIKGLPTVLVLDEHAAEVGRIVGYSDKAAWLARLDGFRRSERGGGGGISLGAATPRAFPR
ncbi:MAG: thioredoxin family protein [Myxococcota bacterium]